MPQFDISTYASQIFWLFVSFTLLLGVMAGYVLPRFHHIMKQRNNHIKQLEIQLSSYENQLNSIKEQFETELTYAKSQAQKHVVLQLEAMKVQYQDQINELTKNNKKELERFQQEMITLQKNTIADARDQLPSIAEEFYHRFTGQSSSQVRSNDLSKNLL